MSEILNIFCFFFILILFFLFPYFSNQRSNKESVIEIISINIIIFMNLFLFFSFFRFNNIYYFYIQIFLSLFFLFCFLKKKSLKNYFDQSELKLFILYCLLNITLFALIANNLRLEWDGLAFWFYKTKAFFDGGYFKDLSELPYKNYPHLGPYIWAFFWKVSFLKHEYVGRFFYIFIYLTSIFLSSNLIDSKKSLLRVTYILFVILITFEPMLFGGYQEYLIFSILLICSVYLYKFFYFKEKNYIFIILILLSSHLLVWIKQEGIFYFIFISTILFYCSKKNKKIQFLVFAYTTFIIIIHVAIFINLAKGFNFQSNFLHQDLMNNLKPSIFFDKLIQIIFHLFKVLLKYPIWIFIFLSVGSLFISFKNQKVLKYFILFFLMNFIFLFAVFIHTPYNLNEMLSNSLDRLMLQTSGFYIPLLIYKLNHIQFKKNKL